MKKALLLIDIQNDFCAGGSLAVPSADFVIPVANKLMPHFENVIATQDYHPLLHKSFAANHLDKKPGDIIQLQGKDQILWPVHCVQKTWGAAFHSQLDIGKIQQIIYKGQDPNIDSYSGFFDNHHLKATGLHAYLQESNITTLFIMGLATDYCVKYTCLDAIELGYTVFLILEGCRAVNLHIGDDLKALDEMKNAGVITLPAFKLTTVNT